MAAANRANVFSASQKVVKKHYKSAGADKRSILEQLVFAALLENAPRKIAEDNFESLLKEYIDWNEIRVTSVAELAEMFVKHPTPEAAASRMKILLQNIFESVYGYDLEGMKKGNQGKAVTQIEQYGATPFVVGYVTQHGLGGHSIPVDSALVNLMFVLGALSDKEMDKLAVPGIERAIPKTKGVEYADMIHELAVDFQMAPFSKKIRDLLLEISPDAKARFPKRVVEAALSEEPATEESKKKTSSKKASTKKAAPSKTAKSTAPTKKTAKQPETKKKASTKSATAKKTTKKSSAPITKKKPK